MAPTQLDKGTAFRELHEGDPFVFPNPWDAGSARVLEALGFKALATTSGGFAFSLGRLDGDVTLDEVVEHTSAIARASTLPVAVDLENGYGPSPEDAARAITRVAEAGAVGGSIEDWDPDTGTYDISLASERISAAAEAAQALEFPFTLTARAENYFRGNPDLDDTITRLQAYEAAGADVVYAPRLPGTEEIRAISDATSKPQNVLARADLSMSEIVAAGGQRVSVGAQLAWVAIGAMSRAATDMRDHGSFAALTERLPLDEWLSS
ncbi:MAG: isocitrate lyase/PEP mutase family protein [Aeromicrobium sp.]